MEKSDNNKKKMGKNTTERHRRSDDPQSGTKRKKMDTRKKEVIHYAGNQPGGQKCKKKIPSLLNLNLKKNATPEEKLLERKRRFQLPDLDCDPPISRKVPIKSRLSKKPEPFVGIIIDYQHKDRITEPNVHVHKKDQENIIEDIEAATRNQNKTVKNKPNNIEVGSDSCNNCIKANSTTVNNKVIKGQNLNYKEIQKIRSRRRSQVLEALHKTEKRICRRKIGVWITNRPDPPKEIESYGPSPCVGFEKYELQEFYYYKQMDEEEHFNGQEFGDPADAETELSDWSSTSTSASSSSPSRTECNKFTETETGTKISSTCKSSVDFDILKTIKLEPLTETEAETETESDVEIGKVLSIKQKHTEATPNRVIIQNKNKPILNKKRLKHAKNNPPNPLPTPPPTTTTTTTAVAVYNPNSNQSSKEKEILEGTRAATLSLRLLHCIATNLSLMAIKPENRKLWLQRKLDCVVEQCDSNVKVKVESDDDLKKPLDQNFPPDEDLSPATAGLELEGKKQI